MKLFLFTFAIALVIQCSVAAPVTRHKRNDLLSENFQETLKAIKELLLVTEVQLKNSLKEIPKTPNYVKYVQLIEEYLTEMEEYKKNRGNCFEKNLGMAEKYDKLMEEINTDDGTPEVNEIARILERNDGDGSVKDDEELAAKLNNLEIEEAMKNISLVDVSRTIPFLMEVC